jgi:hypothetical protein
MTVIGTFPILSTLFTGDAMGVVVMLMFGLGFLVVFLLTKRNWWALIPAGVFTSIALVVLLVTFKIGANGDQNGLLTGVLLAGIGTTFGILWLMRHNQPTFWAKYPALGLYVAALLALFTGERFKLFWPIVLIILGLALLLSYLFRKPEKVQENPQKPSEEL